LQWRLVGPLRAGWATAATGVPGQPETFYFGAADGRVWKTTDAGEAAAKENSPCSAKKALGQR